MRWWHPFRISGLNYSMSFYRFRTLTFSSRRWRRCHHDDLCRKTQQRFHCRHGGVSWGYGWSVKTSKLPIWRIYWEKGVPDPLWWRRHCNWFRPLTPLRSPLVNGASSWCRFLSLQLVFGCSADFSDLSLFPAERYISLRYEQFCWVFIRILSYSRVYFFFSESEADRTGLSSSCVTQ